MKNKTLLPRKTPSMPQVNCRFVQIEPNHIRVAAPAKAGESYTFSGYAVKWESINSHGEQFVKGAFTDLINAVNAGVKKVHMYYNHGWRNAWIDSQMAMRIGRWTKFTEDDVGLMVEGTLTVGLSLANDVQAMLADGTVDGLSIAFFQPSPMDYEEKADRVLIKRADVYEISPCDEPSDNDARIDDDEDDGLESDDEVGVRDKEIKAALRDAGISDDAAAKFLTRYNKMSKPQQTDSSDLFAFLDAVKIP